MKYTEEERLTFARSHKEEWPENVIDPTATIHPTAVIGTDGFGYVRQEDGTLLKMPHAGNVVIEANVEINAHSCVDRAVIGSTRIKSGTKIDNLVHVAHGVTIGKNCLIVAGSIIGGSCIIGDNSFIGTNASIRNKITVGSNVTIGSGAVVVKDVPDNEIWAGCPAEPIDVVSKYPPLPLTWDHDIEFAKYLVGFVDGEAYFSTCSNGNYIAYKFGIELSKKDKTLLQQIKDFFGVGVIRDRYRKTIVNKLDSHQYSYTVGSAKELNEVIIPFFDNYQLRGFKKIQYKRWREKYLDYRNRPGAQTRNNPARKLEK